MTKTAFLSLLVVVCATSAAAQTNPPLSCQLSASNPPLVRIEGASEQLSDVIFTCTGGTPTPAGSPIPVYTITATLNVPLASRAFTRNLSEALLIVDEAFPAHPNPSAVAKPQLAGSPQNFCRAVSTTACSIVATGIPNGGTGGDYDGSTGHYNVFEGFVSGQSSVAFTGVPIDAPGPAAFINLRMTNVRADASRLPMPSPFSLSPVTVSISGSLISSAPLFVGYATTGLTVTQTGVSPIPNSSYSNFSVAFKEGFASSFKARTLYRSPGPQNVPGFSYNSESGMWDKLTAPNGLAPFGLADHGTRLMVHFSGSPGVKIIVPSAAHLVGSIGSGQPPSNTGSAGYVATDADGNSSDGPVAPTSDVVVLTTDSQGHAWAAYEVVNSDPNTLETLTIPVMFQSQGAVVASGSFAPLVTPGGTAIPRFVQ